MVRIRPKSYNNKNKRKADLYQESLQIAFLAAYPVHTLLSGKLYGLVYHFYRSSIGIDADNLSKPVWDGLTGILFNDDEQIVMRIAGSFNLEAGLPILDFSGLSGVIIDSLLEATETAEHVLYIECGKFDTTMIRLNLEQDGDQT